jgi:hypothetical protein
LDLFHSRQKIVKRNWLKIKIYEANWNGFINERSAIMSVIKGVGLLLATSLSAAASAQPSIVGTYRLISTKQTVVATGQVTTFGNSPIGFIMYGADGRMMDLVGDAQRPIPSSGTPDDATKARLYETMGGYGGTYTFDGEKVIHHIDIATRPAMVGTDVVRYVQARGDTLIFTTKAAPSPRDGVVVTLEFVWQKLPDSNTAAGMGH